MDIRPLIYDFCLQEKSETGDGPAIFLQVSTGSTDNLKPELVLKAYHEQTEPLVDFYRQRGKLAVIPFNDSIEATTAEIMKALEA